MTVDPGFGGQKFVDIMLKKIEDLRLLRENLGLKFEIEVDGGINLSNVAEVVKVGADIIVAGSAIFESQNPMETIEIFKKAGKR